MEPPRWSVPYGTSARERETRVKGQVPLNAGPCKTRGLVCSTYIALLSCTLTRAASTSCPARCVGFGMLGYLILCLASGAFWSRSHKSPCAGPVPANSHGIRSDNGGIQQCGIFGW